MNELYSRFVYGLRLIGRGVSAGRKLCAVFESTSLSLKACIPPTRKTPQCCYFHWRKIMNDAAKAWNRLGAYRIFERSEDHECYDTPDYYGDGDSKAFDAVKDIYGKESVTKLECIGHIQKKKRVGTRLRKLKSRNKGLGERGRWFRFPLPLTKLASLRRLFLAQQPLAMELPLASPASCELRSVIRFSGR
ncbi:uncharacterized protein TNCV_3866951 [Trichonephila clavipes]|nr:uncharacterized protein TNCV_3866951 [Trichonephila clavipes]